MFFSASSLPNAEGLPQHFLLFNLFSVCRFFMPLAKQGATGKVLQFFLCLYCSLCPSQGPLIASSGFNIYPRILPFAKPREIHPSNHEVGVRAVDAQPVRCCTLHPNKFISPHLRQSVLGQKYTNGTTCVPHHNYYGRLFRSTIQAMEVILGHRDK